MTNPNDTTGTIARLTKVDDHVVDHSRCSIETLDKGFGRTIRHVLRNEVDSKVLSWAASDEGKAAGAGEGDTDSLTESQKAVRLVKRNALRDAFIAKFYDGSWAAETRADSKPRLSPLDRKTRELAWADISNRMAAKNYVIPTAKKPVAVVGLEGTWTPDQLIDRTLYAPHNKIDFYKSKAEGVLAAEERARVKAMEKAKDVPDDF